MGWATAGTFLRHYGATSENIWAASENTLLHEHNWQNVFKYCIQSKCMNFEIWRGGFQWMFFKNLQAVKCVSFTNFTSLFSIVAFTGEKCFGSFSSCWFEPFGSLSPAAVMIPSRGHKLRCRSNSWSSWWSVCEDAMEVGMLPPEREADEAGGAACGHLVILSFCHLVIPPLDHGWRNVMGREERGWRCIYDNTDEAQIPKYSQWCHHLW